MLAMADPEGFVNATAPGIAREANVPLEKTNEALATLEAPDPASRTTKDSGRRIRRVDGGYVIINYGDYRKRDHTNAERQARFRARRNGVTTVTPRYPYASASASASVPLKEGGAGEGRAEEPVASARVSDRVRAAFLQGAIKSIMEALPAGHRKGAQGVARWLTEMRADRALVDQVVAGIKRLTAEDDEWRRGYVPHADRIVREGLWNEEPKAAPSPRTPAPKSTLTDKLRARQKELEDEAKRRGHA